MRVGITDVTEAIREPRVSDAVSGVARVPGGARRWSTPSSVRSSPTPAAPGVVVEGRDITTVVAPDAPVRILLTAAPEVRAARRSAELDRRRTPAPSPTRCTAATHPTRAVVDFLTAAPGVEVVDSTDLDFEQTVDAVLDVVRRSYAHRQEHDHER